MSTITQHGFAVRCSQGLLDSIANPIRQPEFRHLVYHHVELYPAEYCDFIDEGVVDYMEFAYHKANQKEGRLRILYLDTRLRQQFLSPSLLAWLVGLGVYWIDDMDLRWSITIPKYPEYNDTHHNKYGRIPNARLTWHLVEVDLTDKRMRTTRFAPWGWILSIKNKRRYSHRDPAGFPSGSPFLDQSPSTC